MRALLVVLSLLTASSVLAQEAPPPPVDRPVDRPAEDPTPVEPPPVDDTEEDFVPLPRPIEPRDVDEEGDTEEDDDGEEEEGEDDDDGASGEQDEEKSKKNKKQKEQKKGLPLPDIPDTRDDAFAGPFWGSSTGCVFGGCVPALGTAVGAGFLIASLGGQLTTTCATAGVVIGAPSALVLGPCASGGALAGGLAGAMFDDRDLVPIFIGGLPGLALGVLGTAGAAWGLIELGSSSAADAELAATILGIAAATSLAAGPVTVVGMTLADTFTPEAAEDTRDVLERAEEDRRDERHGGEDLPGGVIVTGAVMAPPAPATAPPAGMAF